MDDKLSDREERLIDELMRIARTIASNLENLTSDLVPWLLSMEQDGRLLAPYEITLVGADGTLLACLKREVDGDMATLSVHDYILDVSFPVTVTVKDNKGRTYERIWSVPAVN